ncbi:RdRP-domain-containing protein [Pseudovirgaria hyperparasitica]|uniref:RNA-dependent RNA polymerase n=1 Tax=Pseudovirgaria hyperparasitica TaxID=470096 RepID=A0A6A6WIT3_9PEZI|nr:RdRP-domain-containing protein [Pseudovirgaria hyperparasitica]KAF2762064.1 RdRP-domain-containing protein [Pseudovirgaria hyperparasitica]
MEVFMHNVPGDLTDKSLAIQLRPVMEALNIRDWRCEKVRKKAFATITFLHTGDGIRFRHQHEQEPVSTINLSGKPQYKARLHLLGNEVYCTLSHKNPNPFLLKSLAKVAEDRSHMEKERRPEEPKDDTVVFTTKSISCGCYRYMGKSLAYFPEFVWPTIEGSARFLKQSLFISYRDSHGCKKVEIPFRIIESLVASAASHTLTLTLWEPPKLYQVHDQQLQSAMAQLSFNRRAEKGPDMSRLSGLTQDVYDHQRIMGLTLVFQLTVSAFAFDVYVNRLIKRETISIWQRDLCKPKVSQERSLRLDQQNLQAQIQNVTKSVPFSVLFQMEALVRNGYLLPSTVEGLLKRIATCSESISDTAIRKLFEQLPFPGPEVDASVFDLDELWDYLLDNEIQTREALFKPLITDRALQNIVMVYKARVTPTRTTLHGPEPEAKNRVLRRFPEHTNFFLRVQFCEEDGTDLQFSTTVSNRKVYDRFTSVLNKGISICGRVYGFLGFSHSSLRSHAAWFMSTFFSEKQLQSYVTIIKWLGNFDKIRSPARCAARIGQAFSETPLAVSLTDNSIKTRQIPDVSVRTDGVERVFSDGVGLISQTALELIHKALPNQNSYPTCFQIRWGGAKGMISLHTRLQGNVMLYRPSMVKFESQVTANLEICDLGRKPIAMMLNRQLVKILEDLGVSYNWFSARQQEALRHLRLLTANVTNTVSYLQHQKIADSIGFPQLIRRLNDIGASYKHDRFLRSVVETLILRELRLLKHKARIEIREGVTLFGIMDETGYLEEGEVFITFEKSKSGFLKTSFLDLDNQQIIVTRSPALHPGDIQLATNIVPPDYHSLRAHRNCIIFSQKGQRDLPSCLSGGDLDGDIYNIIWDQNAVRECRYVQKPADYARVTPISLDRPVTKEDMSSFFVKFMETDQLGIIAVKHMCLADQKDAGTIDAGCKTLAEMHSTGVDYSKTGIPIDMSQLRGLKIDRHRPDFLAPAPIANIKDRTEIIFDAPTAPSAEVNADEESTGPSYSYYKSDKALGRLYRAVDEKKVWYDEVKTSYKPDVDIWSMFRDYVYDELDHSYTQMRYSKSHIKEAWEIRHAYEGGVATTTADYSEHASKTLTELEFFTGNIFNKTGSQTPRQRDKSMKLKDEFDRITKWGATMMRRRNLMALEEDEDERFSQKSGTDEALKLCLACFDVGRMDDPQKRNGMGGRAKNTCESFKVVAACCVVKELDAAIWRAEAGH